VRAERFLMQKALQGYPGLRMNLGQPFSEYLASQ